MAFSAEERRKYLGGSDCAAAAGMNEWQSRYQLYQQKMGLAPAFGGNAATQWGNMLEEPLRQVAARQTGLKFRRSNQTFRHSQFEYCVAHVDGLHREAGLEVKTASFRSKKKFAPSGEVIMEPGEGLPLNYYCQVQWYSLITGKGLWYVVVGILGENDIRLYKVPYNKRFAEQLLDKCTHFWEEHIVKGIPPELEFLADMEAAYPRGNDEKVECPQSLVVAVEQYRKCKQKQKQLQEQMALHEAQIKGCMREAQTLVSPATGLVLATWKDQSRKVLDTKKLKEEQPKLTKAYELERTSRVFKLVEQEDFG